MEKKGNGWPKGKPRGAKIPGSGRVAGVPNKVTTEFREAVKRLLELNAGNYARWMMEVADGCPEKGVRADPGKALDLTNKLADYANPRMARMEHVGDGGGPVAFATLTEAAIDARIKELEQRLRGAIIEGEVVE
jgi:hypothetical protein